MQTPRFPWLLELDADKVLQWMQDRFDAGNYDAFNVEKLKELLSTQKSDE